MKVSHIFSRLLVPRIRGEHRYKDHATPHLDHKEQFRQILQNYQMNPSAKGVLQSTPLVVLNGPSGAGRNTIIRELLKTGHYHFVVSDTTRPPRYNDGVLETNGVEYFFRTEAEMLDELTRGECIEAELIHDQQVSGQSIREIRRAHAEGKIALNEIEILGVVHTLQIKPDTVAILLLPPSFEEWLRRLQQRNAVQPEEVTRRLRTAITIFTYAIEDQRFKLVVNDDMSKAVKTIDDIARLGVHHKAAEQQARQLAHQLRQHTLDYLAEQPMGG